jgi:hypothetical protein
MIIERETPMNYFDTTQEIKERCGQIVADKVKELIDPVRQQLPPFIYVDSFSTNYQVRSKEDWQLRVIHYDVKNHQLHAVTIQFAYCENNTFKKVAMPLYSDREVLGMGQWLEHAETLTKVILEILKKVRQEEKYETPKHKVTGHLLVPVPYSHPQLSEIVAI